MTVANPVDVTLINVSVDRCYSFTYRQFPSGFLKFAPDAEFAIVQLDYTSINFVSSF
jgi:hypothetical protein